MEFENRLQKHCIFRFFLMLRRILRRTNRDQPKCCGGYVDLRHLPHRPSYLVRQERFKIHNGFLGLLVENKSMRFGSSLYVRKHQNWQSLSSLTKIGSMGTPPTQI